MKKLLIIPFLLLITSCSIDNEQSNLEITNLKQEKQELIDKNNELLKNVNESDKKNKIFDNNLKCIGYKNEINIYVDKYLKMTSMNKSHLKGDSMIFYSPKTNSCLFSIWTALEYDDDMTYSFRLFEYGTENEIVLKNYFCKLNSNGDIQKQAEYFQCAKTKNNNMLDIIEDYR